ncbi:MAG: preprotein translocase subunit SecG [Actinobacteria bacterium]|nr:preprotein translocase subunit SecG [Actinomycetota bacterium]
MVLFVGILYVVIAVIMCILVLLHSGEGGGLSDFMGGGAAASGSTVMEKNLDRITVVFALIFAILTILLGLLMLP